MARNYRAKQRLGAALRGKARQRQSIDWRGVEVRRLCTAMQGHRNVWQRNGNANRRNAKQRHREAETCRELPRQSPDRCVLRWNRCAWMRSDRQRQRYDLLRNATEMQRNAMNGNERQRQRYDLRCGGYAKLRCEKNGKGMKFPEQFRKGNHHPLYRSEEGVPFGIFKIGARYAKGRVLLVMAVDGRGTGWEHVSVSLPDSPRKCPSWDEMRVVKDLFWNDDECVVQFHPAKKDYINNHPGCLHLWRPVVENMPIPPKLCV